MTRAPATAKINLALVVGPRRADGKHEVETVLQRIDLADRVSVQDAPELRVDGFPEDTLVADALRAVAEAAGSEPRWRARIWKQIPVATGLGGGSSDAATALRLAHDRLGRPLDDHSLHALAAGLGSDVPFFLTAGPQVGKGDGSELEPVELPQDYWVVLVLPRGLAKASTAEVYRGFDERGAARGWEVRRDELRDVLRRVRRARDLAALPPNDLATSPVAAELRKLGAFRADVSGAGPAVYGLFTRSTAALAARDAMGSAGRTWLTVPTWYGDPR